MTLEQPKVSLLFVSYNSFTVLSKLLGRFENYQKQMKVVVVDNASRDGSAKKLQEAFPFVQVLAQEKNRGYGVATNVWLEQSQDDFVFLLNPDLEIDPKDVLQLVEIAQETGATVVAPVLEKSELKTQKSMAEVESVCGAAMLFNMKKLKEIGYFDPNIFLFYEETDLCKRIINAGHKIIVAKHIMFEHEGGASSEPSDVVRYVKAWHSSWSKLYYMKKYQSCAKAMRKTLSTVIASSCRYLIYLIKGKRAKQIDNKGRLAGAWVFLLGKGAFNKHGDPRGF